MASITVLLPMVIGHFLDLASDPSWKGSPPYCVGGGGGMIWILLGWWTRTSVTLWLSNYFLEGRNFNWVISYCNFLFILGVGEVSESADTIIVRAVSASDWLTTAGMFCVISLGDWLITTRMSRVISLGDIIWLTNHSRNVLCQGCPVSSVRRWLSSFYSLLTLCHGVMADMVPLSARWTSSVWGFIKCAVLLLMSVEINYYFFWIPFLSVSVYATIRWGQCEWDPWRPPDWWHRTFLLWLVSHIMSSRLMTRDILVVISQSPDWWHRTFLLWLVSHIMSYHGPS